MKTIKELSVERSIDRSTLLKAAQQGRIPARKSGATWLVDDESLPFAMWLAAHLRKHRKNADIPQQSSDAPDASERVR